MTDRSLPVIFQGLCKNQDVSWLVFLFLRLPHIYNYYRVIIMELTEAISCRIKDLCAEWNMTVDMLIQKMNAFPTAVALVISGSDELVMLDVMKSICDVFGISMMEFFNCELFSQF